jgi:hypothetical protein
MSYGIPERCALIILAAAGGQLMNRDLKAQHGLDLKKPARERLVRDGLLATPMIKRSYILRLTDAGWAFVSAMTDPTPPPRSGSAGGAAFALIASLNQALQARGEDLRGVLAAKPITLPPAEPAQEAPARPVGATDLPTRIRQAYHAHARRPREWVPLRVMRRALPDVPRAAFDQAIRTMRDRRALQLTLEEDPSRLTQADRDAAIRIGPDPMHYVSID